jgi:hypothetical protein
MLAVEYGKNWMMLQWEVLCNLNFMKYTSIFYFGGGRLEKTAWRWASFRILRQIIFSAVKSVTMSWAGQVARMWEMRHLYKISVGKSECKISRGRPRRRWEDNIRLDLREIGWEGVEWIYLADGSDQCGLLWTRSWTFGFYKVRGIYWPVERLLASEQGLCSMKLYFILF